MPRIVRRVAGTGRQLRSVTSHLIRVRRLVTPNRDIGCSTLQNAMKVPLRPKMALLTYVWVG